jgi:hypothetical protein
MREEDAGGEPFRTTSVTCVESCLPDTSEPSLGRRRSVALSVHY